MTITNAVTPIVVGIESKQTSALRWALDEAESRHCGVRIVHVSTPAVIAYDGYFGGEFARALEEEADAVLATARSYVESRKFSGPVDYVLQIGDPRDLLANQSAQARSVVLGPDDNAWYERLLVGDVGASMLRHSKSPVVVVPEHWFPHTSRRYGVIVTVDGTSDAHGPLSYAFSAAERSGHSLHVLHIVPTATSEDDEDAHRLNIAEVLAGWSERYPSVEILRSLVFSEVDEACIGATKLANLVVVGRPHGHSAPLSLSRPVAVSVVKEANCPVAVVPSDYDE